MNLTPIDATSVGLCAEALEAQAITLVDPTPILEHINRRFNFPTDLFAGLAFFQASHKIVRAATLPLEVPRQPSADRIGIDFLRIDMANPRMTTSAIMTWGRYATTNFVDTDRDQCRQFLSRAPVELHPSQHRHCTARGFVAIRHLSHGIGVGFLESTTPKDHNFGRIRSMYPRAFSDELQRTSPFGNPS